MTNLEYIQKHEPTKENMTKWMSRVAANLVVVILNDEKHKSDFETLIDSHFKVGSRSAGLSDQLAIKTAIVAGMIAPWVEGYLSDSCEAEEEEDNV